MVTFIRSIVESERKPLERVSAKVRLLYSLLSRMFKTTFASYYCMPCNNMLHIVTKITLQNLERSLEHKFSSSHLDGFVRIAVGEAYTKLLEKDEVIIAKLTLIEQNSFIRHVAVNKILNEIKRLRNNDRLSIVVKNNTLAIVFDNIEKNQIDQEYVLDLLESLPKKHSDILRMHYSFGYSVKQISVKTTISIDAVKKRLKVALKEMRNLNRIRLW